MAALDKVEDISPFDGINIDAFVAAVTGGVKMEPQVRVLDLCRRPRVRFFDNDVAAGVIKGAIGDSIINVLKYQQLMKELINIAHQVRDIIGKLNLRKYIQTYIEINHLIDMLSKQPQPDPISDQNCKDLEEMMSAPRQLLIEFTKEHEKINETKQMLFLKRYSRDQLIEIIDDKNLNYNAADSDDKLRRIIIKAHPYIDQYAIMVGIRSASSIASKDDELMSLFD